LFHPGLIIASEFPFIVMGTFGLLDEKLVGYQIQGSKDRFGAGNARRFRA